MSNTIAQKIYNAHLLESLDETTGVLKLDRVFCHEITTPIAVNDLRKRGKNRVFDSKAIKAVIDHVTPAKDSKTAIQGQILRQWAKEHDIEFYDIGRNGVCHALFPEQGFVLPGQHQTF